MPTPTESSNRRTTKTTHGKHPAKSVRKTTRSARAQLDTAPAEVLDETSRIQLIAVAAYYRALARGFAPGDPVKDWVEAEAEIAKRYPR